MGALRVVRYNPPLYLALLLLVLLLAFTGCVVGDFLGAYFNTYYNASTLFNQAEEDIWGQPDTKLSGRNLLIDLNASAAAKTKLTTVVVKCSKLLQDHPDSKFVDDALLMIGKAFFYQGDFTGADRKFKELLTTYPQSGLVMEARVWMAYAEYKEKNLDRAEASAKQVYEDAKQAGDRANEAYAAMLMGRIRADRLDYQGSCSYYMVAGEEGGNADLRATAYLVAGDMSVAGSDSAQALKMYTAAEKESRNYVITYHALLGEATTLSRLGRGGKALDLLTSMRHNLNYKEFWGQVDVETGNAYRRMGNYPFAIQQYQYVDTAYARSEWAVAADYHLGLLWEKIYGDFDSARVAYGRGKGANAQFTFAPLVAARYDLMTRYATYRKAIQLDDSLLIVAANAPAQIDTGTAAGSKSDTVQPAQADSKLPSQDTVHAAVKPSTPPVPVDTLHARLESAINELATLFYAGFSLPDSAEAWFDTLLTRYPNGPNTPRAWYVHAQIVTSRDTVAGKRVADSLYSCIVQNFPQSEFATVARRKLGLPPVVATVDSAEVEYHQAEELLLKGEYQSAIDSFLAVSKAHPRSPFASRAQYAVGWLYEEKLLLGDSALTTYRNLIKNYPSSSYAALVRPRVEAADLELRKAQEEAAEEAKKKAAEEAKAKGNEGELKKPAPPSVEPKRTSVDSTEHPVFQRGRLGRIDEAEDSVRTRFPKPPGADSANVRQVPR